MLMPNFRNVSAVITKISKSGSMIIKFSEDLIVPPDFKNFNNSILNIKAIPDLE